MDTNSDNDTSTFQLGRRQTPPSSRESSPASKRQRRSFTPTSDDGDLVIPVAHNEVAETPTPENAPLIRQAVGFSSINANVSTYQATVPPQPVVPYFLPGQAPTQPPKPKPRAPRKKKSAQYSNQTSKFKLSGPSSSPSRISGSTGLTPTVAGNTSGTSSSSGTAYTLAISRPMIPTASHTFSYANGSATAGPSNANGATTSVVSATPSLAVKRTTKSSKRKAHTSVSEPSSQSSARPPPAHRSVTPQCPSPGGSPIEGPARAPSTQRTSFASGGVHAGRTNGSTTVTRPVRMVTLLIEDLRSGIPDSQLAEVRVPMRVADDPEDGFWADAIEISNALQKGPSRIDGPAKVFTMRGRFRQFFMRVDEFDQFQAQSAYLGVSKERTLNVFVEAPMPQGQLPRPPVLPPEVRPVHGTNSNREAMSPPAAIGGRPTYSLPTLEDQIERLSRSRYARAERRPTPVSENGSYGHSHRTTSPNARHGSLRYDQRGGQRPLTPPIPGRLADTQEEKDEAIANYIRSRIENHPGWIDYMQSKAKPQRVSEVFKQYTFVDDRIRELIGRKTPSHWDGAPNCYVEKQHVWRVLKLDVKWGEECEETMLLIGYYGENGSRYQDSRVVDMINDTSPPRANAMEKFLRFLRNVDDNFTHNTFSGEFMPMEVQE